MYLRKQLQHAPWPVTAALGLCLGLTLGALSTAAHAGDVNSGAGETVVNGCGECRNKVGGATGALTACGDETPTASVADAGRGRLSGRTRVIER